MNEIALNRRIIELKDIILGGQDGLVNVLGLMLGLFTAHASARVIVVAGLAAGLSEAVSMGAVAYTSATADKAKIGIVSNAQMIWSGVIVAISALIFSLIPISPFLLFQEDGSVAAAIVLSALVLFIFGIYRARTVGGVWWRSGTQILLIGLLSAFAGFIIGFFLKV